MCSVGLRFKSDPGHIFTCLSFFIRQKGKPMFRENQALWETCRIFFLNWLKIPFSLFTLMPQRKCGPNDDAGSLRAGR